MKNCEPLESGPEFAIETTPDIMGVWFHIKKVKQVLQMTEKIKF